MKRTGMTTFVLTAFILAIASTALSQEATSNDPCRADLQQFCKDVQPGEGRIAACLQEHSQEFSQVCKNHIATLEKGVRVFAKACQSDLKRYCKGIKPGGGRLIFCLKDHEADLSDGCRTLLTKQPLRKK